MISNGYGSITDNGEQIRALLSGQGTLDHDGRGGGRVDQASTKGLTGLARGAGALCNEISVRRQQARDRRRRHALAEETAATRRCLNKFEVGLRLGEEVPARYRVRQAVRQRPSLLQIVSGQSGNPHPASARGSRPAGRSWGGNGRLRSDS